MIRKVEMGEPRPLRRWSPPSVGVVEVVGSPIQDETEARVVEPVRGERLQEPKHQEQPQQEQVRMGLPTLMDNTVGVEVEQEAMPLPQSQG